MSEDNMWDLAIESLLVQHDNEVLTKENERARSDAILRTAVNSHSCRQGKASKRNKAAKQIKDGQSKIGPVSPPLPAVRELSIGSARLFMKEINQARDRFSQIQAIAAFVGWNTSPEVSFSQQEWNARETARKLLTHKKVSPVTQKEEQYLLRQLPGTVFGAADHNHKLLAHLQAQEVLVAESIQALEDCGEIVKATVERERLHAIQDDILDLEDDRVSFEPVI